MQKNPVKFFAAAILFGACAFPNLSSHPGLPGLADDEHFRWVSDGLEIKGEGQPDSSSYTETLRKSAARDAAMVEALGRLTAYEGQISVPGKGKIKDLARKDPAWEAKLKKIASGIEIRSTHFDIDNSAEIIIWVSLDSLEALRNQ